MRIINKIIIHCSATISNLDLGAKEIDVWHRRRGFRKIGYHFVIRRDGKLEEGRKISEIGAHTKGQNANSIGICLIGGINSQTKLAENNFTTEQFERLKSLINELIAKYSSIEQIDGHKKYAPKDCPCFEVNDWLKQENFSKKFWF